MRIPNNVLNMYYKEIEQNEFCKVTLTTVRRGKHMHWEIDKHYLLLTEKDEQVSRKEVDMD